MSAGTQHKPVRIPHPWDPEETVEGVEIDREPEPSFNDKDAMRVTVEVDGTRFAVRGEEVEEV